MRGRASVGAATRKRSKTFTGTVWADPVLSTTPEGHSVGSVTFTPGARSYWHRHPGGQILVITAGLGWVCPLGEQPELVRAGDVVWVPPGEQHWHGGTDNTIMTHLAISLGRTEWLHEVSDEDYAGAAPADNP